ncbi:hypothetical protein J2129_002401 [Methanofollis sp. W23]|nr:hypothetical protein [Methanofollis sp. W23]
MKMILTILSSGLHESVNSPYSVEADKQRIDNYSDGTAASNHQIFPAISRRGPCPRTPTTRIGRGGMTLDFDSLHERKDEGQESIQI